MLSTDRRATVQRRPPYSLFFLSLFLAMSVQSSTFKCKTRVVMFEKDDYRASLSRAHGEGYLGSDSRKNGDYEIDDDDLVPPLGSK